MTGERSRQGLVESKRWVIKIGSNALLRADRRGVDRVIFSSLVEEVVALLDRGCEVTIVSSGAVALGRSILGEQGRGHRDIPSLQALAAVGQPELLRLYSEEFRHYDRKVAQVLLSRQDLDDRGRYLNARRALERMRTLGVVPIINENDTVATEELRFGDNDQLAAMACGVVGADVLVILSDVDGVFDVVIDARGERQFASRIREMAALDEALLRVAGPSVSGVGTGGMSTKVIAARGAARFGVSTVIAPGKRAGVIGALMRGEDVGTLLVAETGGPEALSGRKVWLSAGAVPVGEIVCDEGAHRAVMHKGASLLPRGVVSISGHFEEGDVVSLVKHGEKEGFAVGLAVYGSEAMRALVGAHTEEIEDRIGYRILDCVVHRDNLVLRT